MALFFIVCVYFPVLINCKIIRVLFFIIVFSIKNNTSLPS